jgi:hypothetical protein
MERRNPGGAEARRGGARRGHWILGLGGGEVQSWGAGGNQGLLNGRGPGSRRACPGKGAARIMAGDLGRDWRGRVEKEGSDMGAGLLAALGQRARELSAEGKRRQVGLLGQEKKGARGGDGRRAGSACRRDTARERGRAARAGVRADWAGRGGEAVAGLGRARREGARAGLKKGLGCLAGPENRAASGRKGERERFGPSGCWLLGWIGFSYFSGFPFLSLSNHTQTI